MKGGAVADYENDMIAINTTTSIVSDMCVPNFK